MGMDAANQATGTLPHLIETDSPAEIRRRNMLLVNIRWVMIGVFSAYGLLTGLFYYHLGGFSGMRSDFAIFGMTIAVVAVYNALYHFYFKHYKFLTGLSQVQIFFDLILSSVMIYFCGGILSWVWGMLALLIVEAAFIFDRPRDTWIVTAFCILFHGISLAGEFHHAYLASGHSLSFINVLPPPVVLKVNYWLWLSFLDIGIAFVTSYLVNIIRSQEHFIHYNLTYDRLTGQYNRDYFTHRLNSELERAKRYDIAISVLLVDIDNMDEYNLTYGHAKGNELIKKTAQLLRSNLRINDFPPTYEVDTLYRYYGDTFAVIATEPIKHEKGSEIKPSQLYHSNKSRLMGERLREKVEQSYLGITVSVGVASQTSRGIASVDLAAMAEKALYQAKKEGKNRVLVGEWPKTQVKFS